MCWEDVPRLFSSIEREDFQTVLEETVRVVDSRLQPRKSMIKRNRPASFGAGRFRLHRRDQAKEENSFACWLAITRA